MADEIGVVAGDPALGLTHQESLIHVLHVLHPALLTVFAGVEAGVAVLPHVFEEGRDPVHREFRAAREIGRGMLRPGQHHHVRHAADQEAEKGDWPVGPFLAQRATAGAANVYFVEGAGESVEAGRVDDDVELEAARAGVEAGRGNLLDRCRRRIDQFDIVAVIGLEVTGLQRHALYAKAVVLGDQFFGQHRICHAPAYAFGDVIGELGVGVLVGEDFDEVP